MSTCGIDLLPLPVTTGATCFREPPLQRESCFRSSLSFVKIVAQRSQADWPWLVKTGSC
jgi:hypothetical protein